MNRGVELEVGGKKDPLKDYKGLSLFRRSFPSLPPPAGDGDDFDLLSSHNFLLSLPLIDAKMLAEQGKAVLEGRGGGVDGGARARRPGMGIKRNRAEFRLLVPESGGGKKYEVAEPAELDIDKYKDPEELFLAFEKLENVKTELAKQTGRVLPEQQHGTTYEPRPRRPGMGIKRDRSEFRLLVPESGVGNENEVAEPAELDIDKLKDPEEGVGRGLPRRSKKREYKHLFLTTVESGQRQESVEKEPEENKVTNDDVEEGEKEAAAETQVNKILDELLACEDLVEDGAMNLLRDRLQIKPAIIEKFELPKIPEIRHRRKQRTTLSDVHNLLKEPRIDFKKKKSMGSLVNSASPTPPRSPMASLSLLRRSIMQSDPISDPFSIAELANSPQKNDSPVKDIEKRSDAVHADEEFRCFTESKSPPYQSMDDDMPTLPSGRDVDGFVDPNGGNLRDEGVVKEKSNIAGIETDVQKEDTQIEAVSCLQTNLKFGPALSKDQPEVGCSKTHDDAAAESDGPDLDQHQEPTPGQHNEEKPESSTTIEKSTKAKSRPRKERRKRDVSGRRSLAGFGASWQTGIRRSTRIKSRPLEFWKGERFLYGRVHQSLPTVIGVKKFDSPVNAKRTMKVKSFVSEEFKDLVDLAALG